MDSTTKPNTVALTKFCLGRNFDPEFAGTKVTGISQETLVQLANAAIEAGAELVPGYAPFCVHLFLKNPEGSTTLAGVAQITEANKHLLTSGYKARRAGELPVLGRCFEGLEAPRAEYLDLILYSREQLVKEDEGKSGEDRDVPNTQWGIVAINAEMFAAESPIPPTTMLRNALGKEEGGSGVPLNREAYMASVEFWDTHAVVL